MNHWRDDEEWFRENRDHEGAIRELASAGWVGILLGFACMLSSWGAPLLGVTFVIVACRIAWNNGAKNQAEYEALRSCAKGGDR